MYFGIYMAYYPETKSVKLKLADKATLELLITTLKQIIPLPSLCYTVRMSSSPHLFTTQPSI